MSEQPWVSVIDDDASLRAAVILLLRTAGFHAHGFGSAEEFLSRADAPDPACVLLDVHLGSGLTGYELKERLESEGRTLPIIFMTAHSDLPMRMSRDADAMANCLRKPFGKDDLLARVRRLVGAILVTAMIATSGASSLAQPVQRPVRRPPVQEKRVLMVYAHNPNSPGVVAFAGQLKAVVREQVPGRAEIYDEYLDVDRFSDPARSAQLARYFAEKYQFRPDAIVAEGAPALRFVMDRLLGLFPGVPVVYGGTFEPVIDYSSLPGNVVGRRQPLPYASTYTLARAIQPRAEHVVLVGGASPNDSLLINEARRQITPLLNGTRLTVYQDWTYEGLIDSLRHVPPRTFVLLSDFSRDQRGRKFIAGDLVATLARVASVPVFGIARNWVGDGVVGGGVMDFADDGSRTGRLLVRVLERAPNEPMPASEVATNRLVVDWRQLQRWGLSADLLPPGTEVLFRPASLWERYRGGILAALGLFVVESVLIALLLIERKRRVRAQRAVEQARTELEHMARVATVNGLAAAVSHELRQPLAAIRMNAEAGGLLLTQTPPDVDEARLALQAIVRDDARAAEVVDHYRALLRKQEPISTTVDLNAVCRTTAQLLEHEATSRRARLVLRLDPDVPPVRGDPVQLQQLLINLTLNALDAVSASTSAREAAISTVRSNGDVNVHVSDTGPGLADGVQQRLFEPFFSTKPHGLGMGLTIVRSIVERHNGRLHVENRLVGGALFTVTLPARESNATPDRG